MNVKKRMKHLAALLAVALFVSSIPSTGMVALAADASRDLSSYSTVEVVNTASFTGGTTAKLQVVLRTDDGAFYDCDTDASIGKITYNGKNVKPTPILYLDAAGSDTDIPLSTSDYACKYYKAKELSGKYVKDGAEITGEIKDVGTYCVEITGNGGACSGTAMVVFKVNQFDLKDAVPTVAEKNLVKDGSTFVPTIFWPASVPTVTLKDSNGNVIPSSDYTVEKWAKNGTAKTADELGVFSYHLAAVSENVTTTVVSENSRGTTYAVVKEMKDVKGEATYFLDGTQAYLDVTYVEMNGEDITSENRTSNTTSGDVGKVGNNLTGFHVSAYKVESGIESSTAETLAQVSGKYYSKLGAASTAGIYNVYVQGTGSYYSADRIKIATVTVGNPETMTELNDGNVLVEFPDATSGWYAFTGKGRTPQAKVWLINEKTRNKIEDITDKVTVTYSLDDANEYGKSVLHAGEYDVKVSANNEDYFGSAKFDRAVSVRQGGVEGITVTADNSDYDGTVKTFTAKYYYNGVEISPTYSSNGTSVNNFTAKVHKCELDSTGAPKKINGKYQPVSSGDINKAVGTATEKNAGYYYIEITSDDQDGDFYEDSDTKPQALVKINPKNLSDLTAEVTGELSDKLQFTNLIFRNKSDGKVYKDKADNTIAAGDIVIPEPWNSAAAAGNYTATLEAKANGNYTGTIDVSYKIVETLTSGNITPYIEYKVNSSGTYDAYPNVSVVSPKYVTLKQGEDYTVEYFDKDDVKITAAALNVGEDYYAKITLKKDGLFKSNSVATPYEVTSSDFDVKAYEAAKDLAKAVVKIDPTKMTYTGSRLQPATAKIYVANADGTASTTEITATDVDVKYENNINVGEAKVIFVAKDTSTNYIGSQTATFTISPKVITSDDVQDSRADFTYRAKAYTDTEIAAKIVKALKSDDYTLSYANAKLNDEGDPVRGKIDYETDGAVSEIKDAGIYVVTVTGKGNYTGYAQAILEVGKLSINESDDYAEFTLSKNTYEYTGSAITPAVSGVTTNGLYALDASDYEVKTYNSPNGTVGNEAPAIEPGQYWVRAVAKANGNLEDESAVLGSITVVASSLSSAIIDVDDVEYTGTARTPAVKVTLGGSEVASGLYTVSYDNNVNVGKATVTIKAAEGSDLTGERTETFTINPKPYNKLTVSISTKTKVYNGKTQTTSVTVKDGSKTLKKGTDYSVKYGTNRKIGLIKVKVVMKGNYTGSSSIRTFRIDPATPSFSSLKSAKKGQISVKIKRDSLVTGYQVQVCRNSKFAKGTIKAATLTKNTSVSKTFTKLTSKKTYYVRVRSYKKANGKTYYGAWRVKTIKVK